ncbi:HK97 family phage portal protein [Saccharothrix texasensis]|uniref:HK97 family phage portal protein n=1 Tax=Saccharothrix texasensis TaxID=103734 RepID=A0A3N1H1C4_9PSEU|nr:HK97 family phage portal protein [Saccharothrix texasensis]
MSDYDGLGAGYAAVHVGSAESALQAVAIGSSVDLLASLASELPVGVYTGSKGSRRSLPTPGYLLDPAGDGHGLADWMYQLLVSWLLRGNAFGTVLEQSRGYPTQITLHYPDSVTGWLGGNGVPEWSVDGKTVDLETFRHLRVNPMPGVVLGMSPVQRHARTIGLNLVATQFGLQWFTDGAHPGALLTNSEADLSDETVVRRVKDRFLAVIRGSREPLVLGKGWEYAPIQLKPEESQFLQTQGYSAADCCRIFGPGIAELLGYETGGSMRYTNVESRSAHVLVYALNKWLRRADRVLTSMLPDGQYARIDRDAVLQSTTLERYRAHHLALGDRWKTVNDVRADEELPPVTWGDEPNPVGGASGAGGDDGGPDDPEDGRP